MTFQRRGPTMPVRRSLSAAPVTAAALTLGVILSGCSDPPQPAPEPTGDDIERAWHLAVGSDPLDRTIAQVYAMALNSHEAPTVVVEEEDQTAVSLAAELARAAPREGPETEEVQDEDVDDRYELVIARTMPLAEELDPEGYAELTAPDPENDLGPAAAPEELVSLVEAQLSEAELFEPTAAVLSSRVHITSVTAETYEVDGEEDTDFDTLAPDCGELVVGVSAELPDVTDLLEETYECVPEDLRTADEDTLVDLLITAEIDAALFTSSHPGSADHALISLEDVRRAFPEDQYAPIVSSRVADEVPGVVDEISAALDDEAMLTIRRLIHGDDALDPEDAATYWLVEEGLLAEPENWG
ncbi:glycine betaine ABC transporter substrate-binding protein [Nesterenkonia salmonea]|nr:glycine betaine ABC transporter substrate-binding protein [Nesterenkonia salmonea]